MPKNCLIYETLNGVKEMQVRKDGELMTLSGVFGVCGVRNNNKRVYETSNYSKMVTEMKQRIKDEGGIPGELEHPSQMNITLENVSHKITDINIDENGVVTGSITLLNTPKGKIAQAIVEGGLPLFISSRATGNIDKSGNVCLERIATYDLVGTPGFSQAKLHLNENQIAESINESNIYYITEKENNEDMELSEILERFEKLEERIQELETANEELQEKLEETEDVKEWFIDEMAPKIQEWLIEEYSPVVEQWVVNHTEELIEESANANNNEDIKEWFIDEMAPKIQDWLVEEYSPEIEKWVVGEYSPVVEQWCKTEFASGIQNWIVEEFSPEVEAWLNESYMTKVENSISESIQESKNDNLNAIDETLRVLESLEAPSKPKYPSKVITESNEPIFITQMPAEKRVQWDMASDGVKDYIKRRAKLYNFANEGSVEKFWEGVNFSNTPASKSIYEGLETVVDERERGIRAQFRRWRNR